MKYMGSKRRIWKYISPIILSNRKKNQLYVEPFYGGCNSLCQVNGRRLAADINPYLISMLKSLINNNSQFYPISKDLYDKVRHDYRNNDLSHYNEAEIGWVGFMASYNGRFFDGGYSGNGVKEKNGNVRNYIDENIKNILKQIEYLRDVDFRCCSYDNLDIPKGSIVYCDPPYRNTTKYDNLNFDYEYFYYWAEQLAKAGNKVFISEYWMPPFFEEIWSMEIKCNINVDKNKRIEKLFTI